MDRRQLQQWVLQGISASVPAERDEQSNGIVPGNLSSIPTNASDGVTPLERESRHSVESAVQPCHLPDPCRNHQVHVAFDDNSSRVELNAEAENVVISGINSVANEINRQTSNEERSERADLARPKEDKQTTVDEIRSKSLARHWDVSSFLCRHGRLDPMKCKGLRLISAVGDGSALVQRKLKV